MSTGVLERAVTRSRSGADEDETVEFRPLGIAERRRREREAQRRALEEIRNRYRDEQCDVDDADAIGKGDHYDSVTEAVRSGTVRVRTRR